MSQHPFIIDRDTAEMLAVLLAWNLRRQNILMANGGDPWCEDLLNELCDTFKFGIPREESIDQWAKRVQEKILASRETEGQPK